MGTTVTEELIFEYWDCDKCGQKAIRGDIRNCPSCGNPRNESIRFYRIEGKEEKVTDSKQADAFKAGADWLCSFCETLNSILENNCKSCGASKESSEKNYFDVLNEKKKKEELKKEPAPQTKVSAPINWKKASLWILGFLSGCFTCVYFLTRTHDVEFEVIKTHWERTVSIERYERAQFEDWETEIKGDEVQEISSRNEIKRYEDRQVGTRTETYTDTESYRSGSKRECSTTYESTGSGASKKKTSCSDVPTYSTRSVTKHRDVPIYKKFPVYERKVIYMANKYKHFKDYFASGDDNNPKWPEFTLGKGINGKDDKEEKRTELYLVELKKIDEKEKVKEITKLKTSPEKFSSFYILNSTIKKPVLDISNEISPAKDEELIKEKE